MGWSFLGSKYIWTKLQSLQMEAPLDWAGVELEVVYQSLAAQPPVGGLFRRSWSKSGGCLPELGCISSNLEAI